MLKILKISENFPESLVDFVYFYYASIVNFLMIYVERIEKLYVMENLWKIIYIKKHGKIPTFSSKFCAKNQFFYLKNKCIFKKKFRGAAAPRSPCCGHAKDSQR